MNRRQQGLWILAGGLVLLAWIVIAYLSRSFVIGENHQARPIIPFIAIYAVGWAGFALAFALMQRSTTPWVIGWIVGVAVIARLVLIPSNLIQEVDCYRYALDGMVAKHGVNPYAYAPADLPTNAPPDLQEALRSEGADLFANVSFKEIPTVYPPLAQRAFSIGASLTPWDWRGQRYLFAAVDLLTLGLIALILRAEGKPLAWLLLYAWNPLVLKEVTNAVHVDALVALCLVALCLCMLRWTHKEHLGWTALSALMLAAAVLTKLYPLILLPVCLAFFMRGETRGRTVAVFLGVFATTIAVAYAPYLGVGIDQLTEGPRTYGADWRRNDGAFGLIYAVLDLPAFVSLPRNPEPARVVAMGMWFACAMVAAATLYLYGDSPEDLIWALQTTLLGWFLFLPAAYPWYMVGLIALCALRPRGWAVVLSGVLVLYYLHFYVAYHDLDPSQKIWINGVQHLAIWIAVLGPVALKFIRPRRDMEAASA